MNLVKNHPCWSLICTILYLQHVIDEKFLSRTTIKRNKHYVCIVVVVEFGQYINTEGILNHPT